MPESEKNQPVPEGPYVNRVRRKMEPLLGAWHSDSAEAQGSMVNFLPQGAPIADVLERVLKKKLPAYMLVIFKLRENWTAIAGEVAAKRTLPVRYKDGILDVEVTHPAYRAALSSKTIREAILANVRKYPGAENCIQLRFIPAGSLPMNPPVKYKHS